MARVVERGSNLLSDRTAYIRAYGNGSKLQQRWTFDGDNHRLLVWIFAWITPRTEHVCGATSDWQPFHSPRLPLDSELSSDHPTIINGLAKAIGFWPTAV
jgi:hypothetical protein